MKLFRLSLATVVGISALGLLISPAKGESPSCLKYSCNGSMRVKSMFGETHWCGVIRMEHPLFQLQVDGDVHSFSGPRIGVIRPDADSPLNWNEMKTEADWISLVAIGEVTVTFRSESGERHSMEASRVVFLPDEHRLLIDGTTYLCSALDLGVENKVSRDSSDEGPR